MTATTTIPDLSRLRTSPRETKLWITPENLFVPLACWHFEYFRDSDISRRYGVAFGPEIPTRLAALGVGFVRVNFRRNGALLTLESIRWDRKLRQLIDRLVLRNADALDLVRMHLVDREGQLRQLGCVSLLEMRRQGQAINRSSLGSWNNFDQVPELLPSLTRCHTFDPVPSQRAKNKRVISVPMEEELIAAIEQFAARRGWNRVQAIKHMCRKMLGLKEPKD
jgi:hypothetical protein